MDLGANICASVCARRGEQGVLLVTLLSLMVLYAGKSSRTVVFQRMGLGNIA